MFISRFVSRVLVATSAVGLSMGVAFYATAQTRDQIQIVGSSTVYPFTTIVAERFGKGTSFKTPVIESTGTGGGFKLFCAGIGLSYPDATGASRAVKSGEFEMCQKNGVSMIEFKVGNDGLAFSNKKGSYAMSISIAHIAAALAKQLPVNGTLIDNPNATWADVDAYVANMMGSSTLGLPNVAVRVLVPPPTSGTRDAMSSLFMDSGHKKLGTAEALGKGVTALREDGGAIEVGENDNLIIEKLFADEDLFGVFGYSFYDQNRDKVQSATIDNVELSFDTISSYAYPGARPLYVYVKREHLDVVPGLKEFFQAYISENAMSLDGYLFPAGLVPLSEEDFAVERSKLVNFSALTK